MVGTQKRNLLRDMGYVWLDGRWRHKREKKSYPLHVMELLGETELEESLARYAEAEARQIRDLHLGQQVIVYQE